MNRAAVLHATHDVRIESRPIPIPQPDEVVVKVAAVGICGSDVHYYEHGRIGRYVVEAPMVVGHEAAGEIVTVGEHVDPSRIGQHVALEPGVPCSRCNQCRSGRYNLCPDVRFFATPPVDGAIAQYVAIAADFAHPVPAGLSLEYAAMAEPVSVGIWATQRVGITAGDRVAVTGAGPIGLFAAQVARAFGATTVAVSDVSPFRLERSARLGFGTFGESDTFDVLLECSGAPAALADAIPRMARAGRVALIGMGSDTVALPTSVVQARELTVAGIFRYAGTYPLALNLLASGAVDAGAVITHRFGIAETERALTASRDLSDSLKVIVDPWS